MDNDFKSINKDKLKSKFNWLKLDAIRLKNSFEKLNDNSKPWEKKNYVVYINDQEFDYFTGIGVEKLDYIDVLWCLFADSHYGNMSFNDFCDELGCDKDSIKDKAMYRKCIDNNDKLKEALGDRYYNEVKDYIESLDL